MEIFLPRLPATTRFGSNGDGFSFRVYPVFLNIGVNEKATHAERSGLMQQNFLVPLKGASCFIMCLQNPGNRISAQYKQVPREPTLAFFPIRSQRRR